jgi:hypothetical protein
MRENKAGTVVIVIISFLLSMGIGAVVHQASNSAGLTFIFFVGSFCLIVKILDLYYWR